MGADLLLAVIPACKLTDERLAQLIKLAEADEDGNYEKQDVIDALNEYEDLDGRRDVGTIHLRGVSYLVTGGMSWGESPSDCFDTICRLYQFHDQMETWYLEDNKKA